MNTQEKYLTYRGDLRAIGSAGKTLLLVTVHPEKLPAALYRLDVEKFDLAEVPLPCGGLCLLAEGDEVWIGGDDSQLYHLASKAKTAEPFGKPLPASATRLAPLSDGRLAALCGQQLLILQRKSGKLLQTLDLPEEGTSLAADPGGEWIAVGTKKGEVAVFDCEQKQEFLLSESAKLHEGAVTALLFEPEELRFFSAGADQKLLLTHARGKLEPEDRGRGNSHSEPVAAMLHVLGERFITGGRDKACKTWTRSGATRPATLNEGVPEVVDLAAIEIHERPHLVVAGADNTLRFFLLDAGGRFGAATHRVYDAYDRAAHYLTDDTARRGEALHALAEYKDQRALDLIARHFGQEQDAALRLRATELLAKADHPRSARLLEPLLGAGDGPVRLAALEGLRKILGRDNLRPLELALAANQADVGTAAVVGLRPLAKSDDQARRLLVGALDSPVMEVRRAALLELEQVFPKTSPEATLIAAASLQADTRRLALVRAYQRKLLGDTRVAAALRRGGNDAEADVRRTAFLVSLLSRDKLAQAIRERDKEIHRQLFELESFEIEPAADKKAPEPPAIKPTKVKLAAVDFQPLLSAMSSRAIDTSLAGAASLARLGDPRAFGLLLQLSLEDDAAARLEVCRALAALADQRAVSRLETLINDSAAEVRDAAYTALTKLGAKEPLTVAQSGLGSQHADIRRRALQTLVSTLRKSKAKGVHDQGREMLLLALNDSEQTVRGEALKSSLNLQIGGDPVGTLRFVLASVHGSVRREVLTEAMASDSQPWAWQLLLDLLNDPDPRIRADAFQHVNTKQKGRDVELLATALESRYVDIRKLAVNGLIGLKNKAAQQALVRAIDDSDSEVRLEALDALVDADALEAIRAAMQSPHTDVRLAAAANRAMYNDPLAREPLLAAITAEEPEKTEDQALWLRNATFALCHLQTLGDPECVEMLLPLLDSKHEQLRKEAARAIAWSARGPQAELLQPRLQHADPQVTYNIAFGLALLGEPLAAPLVFSEAAGKVLEAGDVLLAANAYGESGEQRLTALFDSETPWIRNAALLVLLMRDWLSHDGTPARVLAALATRWPRIRLAAADALRQFTDREAYSGEIARLVNDRGAEKAWTIPSEQIEALAQLIDFGPAHAQAEAIEMFHYLTDPDQDNWNFLFGVLRQRYADEFQSAAGQAAKKKLPQIESTAAELTEIAFGAYVGLVREQGSYHGRQQKPSFGSTILSIRQAAIRRLAELATTDEAMLPAARPVLVQALGDPLREVRGTAFEKLLGLGIDAEELAEAALECGHHDIAVEGLKLLTAGAGKKGQAILLDAIATRDDPLALEAAQLLAESAGMLTAAEAALDSPHRVTRGYGVLQLVNNYDQEKAAGKKQRVALLRQALESRYDDTRLLAASSLARLKDKEVLPALTRMLTELTDQSAQRQVITALEELGDPQGAEALLDRLEHDPEKTADAPAILAAVGRFRLPPNAVRLLPLLECSGPQHQLAGALLMIAGYDQRIVDPNDDLPNRDWMQDQHPRQDEVLAAVMQKSLDTQRTAWLASILPYARWALTPAVDEVLGQLPSISDDKVRHAATEAIGWRLKHRRGPTDPLVRALEHRDPVTKFLAAEGLALGGRSEGLSVLLSAVELMSDLNARRRAVAALGELADLRALELLLKLTTEEGHALQEAAAEALGHLGQSDKREEILKLLTRLARSEGSVSRRAIIGLRWLDTPTGWDLLRQLVREHHAYRDIAIEQLGYNDDPATRDLLLKILGGEVWSPIALLAARRLLGEESLEPDYAVMGADYSYQPDESSETLFGCLRRLLEGGEPARLFEVLPKAGECFEPLAFHLFSLDPLPEQAAAEALTSPEAKSVEIAAQVIGRTGKKTHGAALAQALSHWQQKWKESEKNLNMSSVGYFYRISKVLQRLVWAAGCTESAKSELLTLLESYPENALFREIRSAALAALSKQKLTKTDLAKIEAYLDDPAAEVRRRAAELLAQHQAAEAASLAQRMLSDRRVFNRLLAGDRSAAAETLSRSAAVETLSSAAANVHYQPIALPHLIAEGDLATLSAVATDAGQGEATRLGAIEGLAALASAKSEKQLAAIGSDEQVEEALRKAAWRGLRRSKRKREAK